VTDVSAYELTFDWAYQTAVGNRELKVSTAHGSGGNVRERVFMKQKN
jgi:hypothetical protein